MSLDRPVLKSVGKSVDGVLTLGEAPVPAAIDRDDATQLAALFKALGHDGRLMILCHLAGGERTVTALEALLDQRQAAVSQQLARLRLEGLVTTRRAGKAIHYSLSCPKVGFLLRLLPDLLRQA